MCALRPNRLKKLYSEKGACIRQPNAEVLDRMKESIMVKEGQYAQLILKLEEVGVVELVREKPIEINGLFGVPKDGGTKQRLTPDAKRANCHSIDPEYPELPHPGLFMQMKMSEKEELYVGKLDIDKFYNRLRLPEHLLPYFGLPPIYLEKNGHEKKWWPRLRTVPMGWSHSVTISQAVHGEPSFSDASLSEKSKIKEGNSRTDVACRFGRYIDDFFVFGTNKRNVMRTYDKVWSAFEQTGLPPKRTNCERQQKKTSTTILGIEFNSKGSLEPSREKLTKLLSETEKMFGNTIWNVGTLQALLRCWNWFLLLARLAMSVLLKCYELTSSEKEYVKAHRDAELELRLLLALSSLIHSIMNRTAGESMLCSDVSMTGRATLYCRLSVFMNRNET